MKLQKILKNLPLVFILLNASGQLLANYAGELDQFKEARSIQPNLTILQNVLYRVNAEPHSKVLIETDPDFTNNRRWLSSDYMFNALRYEPNQE